MLRKPLISLLILVAIVAGFSLGKILEWDRQTQPEVTAPISSYPGPDELIGQKRPDFILPDLRSQPRSIADWDGQALLINFWATWCAPCREEIPALNRVRDEFHSDGFEVIGVALDFPGMVAEFRGQMPIHYPLLVSQTAADEVMRRYGNQLGGLPYSVFIDKNGVIVDIHSQGLLTEVVLREKLLTLLAKELRQH